MMLEKIKKLKKIIIYLILLCIFLLLLSVLNLTNLLGGTPSAIISMTFGAFSFFVAGFIRGKKRAKNGYVAGLITGGILLVVVFLLSILIFRVKINPSMLIYYAILLISCIVGSVVGINKRKEVEA